MTRRTRPLRSAILVGGALTLTLWASVGAALGAPNGSSLTLGPWQGADYAADGRTSFEPLSLDLVSELLGDGGRALIPGVGPVLPRAPLLGLLLPDGGVAPGDRTDPPPGDGGVPAEEQNEVGPSPPPGEKAPVLSVSIAADRPTVRQGERIVYTIAVRNIGTGAAEGVVAETHIPAGTTQTEGADCEGEPLLVDTDPDSGESIACVNANGLITTGGSDESHILLVIGRIEPQKEKRWRVEVRVNNDTPDDTVLGNHAHARADQHSIDVTSRQVLVTVV